MRIAFYAPLKPPDHPNPSGDRLLARLLMRALTLAGHEVRLASRLRSFDSTGNAARQRRLAALAPWFRRRFLRQGWVPELWFTYHLHHKAPDHLGPALAEELGIPYVVAEASFAGKQAAGPWAKGHAAVAAALGRADLVLGLNPADAEGVRPLLRHGVELASLPPFIDAAPFAQAASARSRHRAALATATGLDPARPWLVANAMMRPGDKLASYRLLAAALDRLEAAEWRLLVLGDGAARAEVEASFAAYRNRIAWLGRLDPAAVPAALAAADLAVWPAVNEAFGMALIEAQAAGLPVVAGNEGGVSAVVRHRTTGLLAPPRDPVGFAGAVARLLEHPAERQAMGAAAAQAVRAHHDLPAAAMALGRLLAAL